jgi:hypothetical protein
METFEAAREFVENPAYEPERQASLAVLDLDAIDRPLTDIVAEFARLPHAFTLQCCYGHFLCSPEQDVHSLEPLPRGLAGPVTYRLAYVAFCLENSRRGRALGEALAQLAAIDPEYVQFGSAKWFWNQWQNSYALQVVPRADILKDEALLEPPEAFRTQRVRDLLFSELRILVAEEDRLHGTT